jgi:hypothetical protein
MANWTPRKMRTSPRFTLAKSAARLPTTTPPSWGGRCSPARRRIVDGAITALQRCSNAAVLALYRNLTCQVPAAEINAARAILDFALRAVELQDLAQRIEELEQAEAQRTKGRAA